MRTAPAIVLAIAALTGDAAHASAQQPGWLRVAVHLTDPDSRITYPAVRVPLTITGEAGAPVYRVETDAGGTVELSLPPGSYAVASASAIPFQGRRYHWSTEVAVPSGDVAVLELDELNGQSTPIPGRGPRVVPFAQYGAPQRLAAGLSLLVPIGRRDYQDGVLVAHGIELQASGGQGGWRVAAGYFEAGFPFSWVDLLVTVTRTTENPRGAFDESTYLGVEAGIVFLMLKPSVGVARRLDGPAELKRTMFTWSAGVHLQMLRF